MILWEKSDCSPDWTELLSILADLAKLTEKCSKNCGLLPNVYINNLGHMTKMAAMPIYGKNPSKIFFSETNRLISRKLGLKH